VGSREITIGDVIRAADYRGDLDSAWAETCWLVEREESATDEEIQASSEKFRTDRDLLTAEETEQWLDERGLTLDEFGDYIVRQTGKETLHPKAGTPATKYAEAEEELQDLLRIDLLLGGEFDRLAEGLAWRLASKSDGGSGETGDLLDELSELETAYRETSAGLLNEHARAQALTLLRLDLTGLELEVLDLESHDAASEALLCLREDGLSMAEVARDGRYPLQSRELRFAELPEEAQPKMISASPGEVVGPFPHGDGVRIYRLARKIEPSLEDAAVKERVDRYLVDRYFSELVARHIHWIIEPSRSYAETR
jgi:hypothetical protein